MRNLQEVVNLEERKVLVRVDFNVPLDKNGVLNSSGDWRIQKSLETIKHLQNGKAKTVLISHIGRDKNESLKPVADYLQKFLPVKFIPTWDKEIIATIVGDMQAGDIVMLENLRQNDGEEQNDERFVSFLASLGSMYVNEAFSVSHRAHASIVGIPDYLQSFAGFWFQKEVENLGKVLENVELPFLFILGGAKFDTKMDLIKKFTLIASEIFIGGALANNFFKTVGFNVGKSLIDKNASVREFFNEARIKIPFDVVVKGRGGTELADIGDNDVIADIGPKTLAELKNTIPTFKTVLWNGPLGLYEDGYDVGSKEILKSIAKADNFSVIGGGDTVELVKQLNLQNDISFVSTGGGAMLEFLIKGTLVGIEALDQN